jgi:MSHA biogenesis protein MshP
VTRPRRQEGFALVTAIFLIVVLASAAVALSLVVGTQHRGASLSLQQARAFHAARSGVEWAMASALATGDCPAPATLSFAEGGLGGFDVEVSCVRTEHADGSAVLPIYHVESVARFGALGDPDHVRRRIGAQLVDDS